MSDTRHRIKMLLADFSGVAMGSSYEDQSDMDLQVNLLEYQSDMDLLVNLLEDVCDSVKHLEKHEHTLSPIPIIRGEAKTGN